LFDRDQARNRRRRYLQTMKADRGSFRVGSRQQLLQQVRHDAYKPRRKLPSPSRCPDCGAVYRRGRWRWEAPPRASAAARCPACLRVRDRLPAASVTLSGAFFAAHRDEILARARHCEQAEKRTHPLQRIMAIAPQGRGLRITTTDAHLARRIGEALHQAYKGDLEYRYSKDDNLLRVAWRR
jgi:NMD protein affecting ribosome stability and mRNA decay